MKKELLIFLLAAGFYMQISAQPFTPQPAIAVPDVPQINKEKRKPFYFGIMGGLNFRFNKFTHTKIITGGITPSPTINDATSAFGGNIGGMINIPVDNRFSFQFNPMYSVESYRLNNIVKANGLFEFPLLAVFTKPIRKNKKHITMTMIGPFMAIPLSGTDPFSGNRNADKNIKTMGGIMVGVTYLHHNGTNFGLRLKLNGGNSWQDEFFSGSVTETYNQTDNTYSSEYRLNSWQMFFGYTFGMKKKNELFKHQDHDELAEKIDSMVMATMYDVNQKINKAMEKKKYKKSHKEEKTSISGGGGGGGGEAEIKNDTVEEPLSPYRGSGDPLKGLDVAGAKNQAMEIGEYFALIIGIDNYTGEWPPLKNGVGDAKATEWVLKSKYKFDYFRTLYNDEASRTAIITQLEWLAQNVKEKDNVFIYFSGHGEFSKQYNKGYWVPADAKKKTTAEYISNTDIQSYLTGIRSKHTLLVSDACFSGDIFRGNTVTIPYEQTERYYTKVHNLNSRQALTSGGVEPVLDGGKDGHSVFAYYMLKALSDNTGGFYDAGQLFNDLKIPVINNSEQTPNFQAIKNTGDEGGQFIFIKK